MTEIFNNSKSNETGYIPAIILSVIISSAPFILFILLYKTSFASNQLWKLILITTLGTTITLIINYYLVSLKKITEIFSDPQKLANEFSKPTKMSQIVLNGHKKKKKKEVVISESKHKEMLVDKITSRLSMKNKDSWYSTSVRIISVFSTVVITSYYLNAEKYLLASLLLAEILFFIIPLVIDFIKIKSMTSAVTKTLNIK